MNILMPSVQWGMQPFSVPIEGKIRYAYIPFHSDILKVDDFWYERRKGPTARELRDHRVWHKPLTTPKGKFSALCHAKFKQDVITWPGCSPDDAIDLMHLVVEVYGTLKYDTELRIDSYGVYRAHTFVRITGPDGTPGLRHIYLYLQPKFSRVSLRVTDHYNVRKPYTTLAESRHDVRLFGQPELPHTEQILDPAYWTAGTMIAEAEQVAASYEPSYQKNVWTQRPHWFYGQSPSIDYVKAQVSNAYQSALRYKDTELVDWSVDALAYNVTPFALGQIDIITGRARAFIDATGDIPLLSENSLQNIAAAYSALKSFAFSARDAAKYFDSVLKAKRPQDWYLTNARGRTRAQQKAIERAMNKASMRALVAPNIGENLDTAGDAWLKGRYAFSTSVLDLGSAWDYFYDLALQNIGKRSGDYKCHGAGKTDRRDECQCTFVARERALEGVVKAFERCYRNGIEPNMYVIWDLIPFSFVVDWFIPIGDSLSAYTRASHFTPEYWEFQPHYDGKQFCYSISYEEETFLGPVSVYTRWYESSPPEVEPAYFLKQDAKPGNSTLCKRVLDGVALFHP